MNIQPQLDRLQEHFTGESLKVYLCAAIGTGFGDWFARNIVWILTSIYIGIKIAKQVRDWRQKDKD